MFEINLLISELKGIEAYLDLWVLHLQRPMRSDIRHLLSGEYTEAKGGITETSCERENSTERNADGRTELGPCHRFCR